MTLNAVLRRIHIDLTELGVAYALVGGLAVSARTEPRFTRDVDLVIAVVGDAEAEALIHKLQARGYGIGTVIEQDATGRLATVRLTGRDPSYAPVVDLLFASSGIEPEIALAAEPLELLKGLVMPVARPGHLIALKVLSRDDLDRPQDLLDLRALIRVASLEDLALARHALELIAARGFHRGRHLLSGLDLLLSGDEQKT